MKMREALKLMQEMQLFLAERGVDVHVDVTKSGDNNHSCCINVFNESNKIVARCDYRSWMIDEFAPDWAKFELEVKIKVLGWWE